MGQLLQYEINPDRIDSEELGNEGIQPETAYEHAIDINAIRRGKYVDSLVNYSTKPRIYHQEPKGNRIIDLGDGKKIIDLRGKGNIYLGDGEAEVFLTKKELRDLCYNLLLHGDSRELYQETEPLSELLSEVEEDLKWGSDGIGELRLENGRLLLKYENPNYSYSYDITEIAKEEGFDFWRYIHALGLERTGLAGGESPYVFQEEEKNSGLMENEKLKKAFALGASILIPLGCSAPGLSGKYNFNAKAVLEDAVKFLKKVLPVDNPDFGVIGVAEAKDMKDDLEVWGWYDTGKRGDFTFRWLDPSWTGPKDESCWQAYKKGWYDEAVEKGLDISYEDFEKFFPQYAIMSLWMERGYPPKNINNYQPKLFLELSNPNGEVRKIAKPNTAPYWKWVYGWWPEGPQEENRDFHFIDDPLNAFISAGCLGECALLSIDEDPYPELLAAQYGPGPNVFAVCIPTFKQIDEHTYQIFPITSEDSGEWKCFEVKYDALDKEKEYPKLYEILERNGFKYIKEVDIPKDVLPEIVFDVQKPPESLIIEKAEKPEPTNDIPTSVGPVPTITEGESSSVGDKIQAEPGKAAKVPGYGIGEILSAIAAAGVALGKGLRRKRR